MLIKLHPKVIKERCGVVSYKRGEAFYRNRKVRIEEISMNSIYATVHGHVIFHIYLKKNDHGFTASCSCPSLSSFRKECQHIAAVLIALNGKQQDEVYNIQVTSEETTSKLSKGLLELFEPLPVQSSGEMLHFESRTVLNVIFECKVITALNGNCLFNIGMSAASQRIVHIREFLSRIRDGRSCVLSEKFTYEPTRHCFDKDTDEIIQLLIQIMEDESMYRQSYSKKFDHEMDTSMLSIPGSFWSRLAPLLSRTSNVTLQYAGKNFNAFEATSEPLPLKFEFAGTEKTGYKLLVEGLSELVILKDYEAVLFDGKIAAVSREEAERLLDLKQMLQNSRTNRIPIPSYQLKFYMEKLLPTLRKMGQVHLSNEITDKLQKTPLNAKLYLDRVKNRLLAGLEFHYENVVIDPLDHREPESGTMIIRDMEKEEDILRFMQESKFNQTERGYYIQNEELEYHFLFHELPKLQKLVQVYATTAVRARIMPKTTIPKIKVKHYKDRTHWLEFTFKIDGISEGEIKEVLAALEEKRKYYRLQEGALLSLETREMEELKRFLSTVPKQPREWENSFRVPIVEGFRLLHYFEDSNAVAYEASFREFLANIEHPERLQYEVPAQLDGVLRNYQIHGFKWMKSLAHHGFGGILADEMGLGKSVQSISFILSEVEVIREKGEPALIVCPSSVTYNWENEIMKFAPELQVMIIDGNKSERVTLQSKLENLDVLITSYPLLRRDAGWYKEQHFHVLFFDEAQLFKNAFSQTARAVKELQAAYRFALTGTPMENALEELWSIYHVVFPELFLGLKEYSELTNQQIARRIRPFMLRRSKEDVLGDLPEKTEMTDSIELLPEEKKLYASYLAKLRHKTFKHLDLETIKHNRIRILAGLTRLRQICCHPALFVEGYKGTSAKFEHLMQIVDDAKRSGRRLLIFSQFTKMLHLISRELSSRGIAHFYLDGHTPSKERVELCGRYNAGERDLFLISLKAGGTGLNLTGADTVVFYDSWWNPAVEEQAADRAHRIGQTKAVQVIKLVAKGTIDEKMHELQEKKRHLIKEVIDPNKDQTGKLTEEDILDLLS